MKGDKDWYVFDTARILRETKKHKLKIENRTLSVLIANYDYLVIIYHNRLCKDEIEIAKLATKTEVR